MTALSNQYCLPDGITPEIFLRDYWQKKPLIIRNGLPEIVGQFEPDDIHRISTRRRGDCTFSENLFR